MTVYDDRPCELGEGPLWHPDRRQLFWFDIVGNRLLSREGKEPREWQFAENVSAAGWVDRETLLIASETALFAFDLMTGQRTDVAALDAENPKTRSNDGRADPQGGFWIGTMDKTGDERIGAIWRYYRGEMRQLYAPITIPNAICFTPDGGHAHFTDTRTGIVHRVALDAKGWPSGDPEAYLDLSGGAGSPDGAVVDADGLMWLAEWGAARVSAYGPDGRFLRAVEFPAPQTSCPAFGGDDLTTLFCTSALQRMSDASRAKFPQAGMTFEVEGVSTGQREHRAIL